MNLIHKLLSRDFYPFIALKPYRYGLIVALGLFACFGVIDSLIISHQEVLWITLSIRFLIIVPAYLAVYFLSFQPSFEHKQPFISFFLGLISMAGLIAMLYMAKQAEQTYFDLYFTAFLLALSFAPLVLWFNKLFTLLFLPLVIILFNATFLFIPADKVSATYLILLNILLITGGILGSYCRYFVINLLNLNIRKTAIMSQRKQMLEVAHQKVEESDKMKRLLLSILSHDIKGPIGNVQVLLQFLSEGIMTPQEFSSHSKELISQLSHTNGILDSVVLWSKSSMCNLTVNEPVWIHTLVADNISGLMAATNEKNITLHNRIDPALAYFGDQHMVRLVLRNLLVNAIKFTENGSITVYATLQLNQLIISVKDEGIGMDKEELEKLFKPDTYYTRTGTRAEKGTGLGLKICQEVIKKFGGVLTVDSEKGKGTTFHFTLPYTSRSIKNSEQPGKQNNFAEAIENQISF